jgi:hypothetical protein
MKTYVHMWSYLAELFLEWITLKKLKTQHITFNTIFQKVMPFMR